MIAGERRALKDLAIWTALGVAFALAHTQAPLYFSNQHQYFLHGHAQAGVGDLRNDWLATTLDPTPVFSSGVAFIQRYLHEFIFQILFFVMIAGYFYCLVGAGALLIPDGPNRGGTLYVLAAMLIFVHAGILRYGSRNVFGVDYPWFLQSGVAGQYVLGPGIQPSAFGVLLLGSVVVFAHGRPTLAVVLSSCACLIHPTYLLAAAMMTVTYMVLLLRERGKWPALRLGLLALLLVAPIVAYSVITFAPSSIEQFRTSQAIIADFRIPHHARIDRWLDKIALLQVLWVGLAIVLARKTCWFLLLLIPALMSLTLTLLQWATGDHTLALVFPWRISVVCVPLATAIIFTLIALRIPWTIETRVIASVLIFGSVIGGIIVMAQRLAYGADERERPALEHVRDTRQPGNVYLIPVRLPPTKPGPPGVFSASFAPPPTGDQKTFISVDLQRFRLFTGAAAYVDYKAIPYKDVDVLEWKRRLDQVQKWYAAKDWSDPAMRKELREERITHVLIPADRPEPGTGYTREYGDDYYRVYRIVE